MNPSGDMGAGGSQDHQFDLLVDGELDEKRRRELLSQLDREPDGWRRCALAFLQAQTWKQALGDCPNFRGSENGTVPFSQAPEAAALRRCSSWRRYLVNVLAMAASFLVALAMGIQLRDRGWSSPRAAHGPAAESVATTMTTPTTSAVPASSLASKAQRSLSAAPASPWQMVTLTAGGGTDGATQSFELPARKSDRLDEAWLSKLPAAIPPEVVEALRQSGHEIEQQRQLLPVEMQDGSRLVIPVDEVDIHDAGRRPL